MTQLTKPVRRVTATTYRSRNLCVALHPAYLEIWEKGRRQRLTVEYRSLLEFACKIKWRQEQAEKKAAKPARGRRTVQHG